MESPISHRRHIAVLKLHPRPGLPAKARRYGQITAALLLFAVLPALSHAGSPISPVSQATAPVLLSQGDSTRAVALDAVTWKAEPFPASQPIPFSSDTRTRVILFARNLDQPAGQIDPSLSVDAEDANHRPYALTIEDVDRLWVDQSINFIVVRLSNEMDDRTGDVTVRLHYHGLVSNGVEIDIGGLAGEPTPTPTPILTPAGNNITLNPTITYQTMIGWEATAQAGSLAENDIVGIRKDNPRFALYRNSLFDQVVSDGINRLRLEIKSGIENPIDWWGRYYSGQITFTEFANHRYEIINDNADPNVINSGGFQFAELDFYINTVVLPIRQRLAARSERLYVNLCYVDFGSSAFEHKNYPAEYAEFMLAVFRHMQATFGFVPDSVEAILEPDTATANWSPQQIGNAVQAARTRLAAAGFNARFVLPSTTDANSAPNYFDGAIAQLSGPVNATVSELSYHRYSAPSPVVLQGIVTRATNNGIGSAMLEWIGGTYNQLHDDLKVANNTSWSQFTLAYDPKTTDDGGTYYMINGTNVNIASRTKFLRQYFKFIRRDAVRIASSSNNGNLDPLAFINTNRKYVVVVRATAGQTFNVLGLPPGSYGIKYTTASQYDVDLSDQVVSAGGMVTTSIPAPGVITVYGR